MSESLVTVAYLIAGILFILSLGGLSAQDNGVAGNRKRQGRPRRG